MYFDEELEFLKNNAKSLERTVLTQDQIDELQSVFQNLPIDYVNYLIEVGFGDLMKSLLKIYPSLCDLSDLGLENVYEIPNDIKLFGDNYSGDFIGFDLSNKDDEVIEFWHDSNQVYKTGKTFRNYIREKISMT